MNLSTSRRSAAGAVLLAAVALTTAGCGGSDDATAATPAVSASAAGASAAGAGTLRVGQLGSAKINEAVLAASGEDKGLPYAVEYSLFPGGGPGFIEASRSGSVDLAVMADTPPIFGQAAKAPIKIVAAEHTVPSTASVVEILVPKGSSAKTLADLKGKKIAVTQATILQYTLIQALEKAGLSYADVTPVNLTPPDAAAAFKSGDVDAIAAIDPQRSLLLAAGATKVADGVGVTAGLGYVVVTDDALADAAKRAQVLDYIQRLKRAQAWADAHTPEWAARYAEVSGLPLPIATSIVERQQDSYVPIDSAVVAAQQEQADAYTELGLLPKKLDVAAEFDDRFNDALTGSGK